MNLSGLNSLKIIKKIIGICFKDIKLINKVLFWCLIKGKIKNMNFFLKMF